MAYQKMDCSNSDDDYQNQYSDDDYYAECEDTMSINYFSSYRTNPHSYPSYADMIKLEKTRQKNLLKEQHRLEKLQKEKKESLELSFGKMRISKHVTWGGKN